jgi:hypothetical protein
MNKPAKTILWLVVAIIVIGGTWYGVSKKSIAPTTKEPIKIVAILPLTGHEVLKLQMELVEIFGHIIG